MSEQLVYRIEGPDGKGPWNSDYAPTYPNEWGKPYGAGSSSVHPSPMFDAPLTDWWLELQRHGYHKAYSFGFSSLGQLRRWFHNTSWLQDLHHAGFTIRVYDATDARHGDRQTVFKKTLSTELYELSLLSSRVLAA